MNTKLILTISLLSMFRVSIMAQDIIVKTNNSRIFTHVVKINDSIVSCKGFEQKLDTTFTLRTKDLKMIIYEIGNIQNFNEKKNEVQAQDYSRPVQSSFEKIEKSSENNFTDLYQKSFEIGAGFTGGIFSNNNADAPYQFNLRAITKPNKKSDILLGINLNYTNKALLSQTRRYSGQGILQFNFHKDNDDLFYLNLMGGIGYFDGNQNFNNINGIFSDIYLPMAHIGLGGKHFFANGKSGIFYEAGLGGPYLFNIGLFFY